MPDLAAYRETAVLLAGFLIIALSANQIGRYFGRFRLPLISGFLFAGILAGPFVLDLVPQEAGESLRFVEETALAFIAFAAGSELYLVELRSRLRSIKWVTAGLVAVTFTFGSLTMLALSSLIPFTRDLPLAPRLAVALLTGVILVARSPSSAIAIINELRAKGPFTQTVMGVTIVSDVVVIVLFTINTEIAGALLTDLSFNLGFIALILVEILLSVLLGVLVGQILRLILVTRLGRPLKSILILLTGYGVYVVAFAIRDLTHSRLPFELLLEPLLICLVGSFLIANHSRYRDEFLHILFDLGPPVYVVFFTLTGASLRLDILAQTWPIALVIFAVRLLTIVIGGHTGGRLAGDPPAHNRISWMAYITQAGVGLGLARQAAVEFPEFGAGFATLMISVIVLNQLVGPPFFKAAVSRAGEAHARGATPPFDGLRDALIFGLDGQSVALARQLQSHGWATRFACLDRDYAAELEDSLLEVEHLPNLSPASLEKLELGKVDAIVAMLSDEENYRLCELAYEGYGTATLVARLSDWSYMPRFRQLGVLPVHPSTALVSLLDHIIRAPSAASMLLGLDQEYDIVDVEVLNRDLDGLALRELRLPLDTLILSLQRDGHTIITHGETRLNLGDALTLIGSPESLEQVAVRFGG